jgi:cyclophilin family peptidyl-prolyl cis-trans isomerase
MLAACGGGGGGGSAPVVVGPGPSVTSVAVTAGTLKYGQRVLVTIAGSRLEVGTIAINPATCGDTVPSTAAPYVSTATTAYFQCTVAATGSAKIELVDTADGKPVGSVAINVPVPQVTMTVSNGAGVSGVIVMTLAPDKAPITVTNFLAYVNSGFYDGTVFHRVSPNFVVQAGGYVAPVATNVPTAKATSAPIKLEADKGLSNTQWTIAMARTNVADSATSQFFINLRDNGSVLDQSAINGAGYAVFGSVTGSTQAVSAIATAPCAVIPFFLPSGDCTPTPNVVITSAVQTQ